MDPPARVNPAWEPRRFSGLFLVALAPVVPQLLGSAFNIWYNVAVIGPLLATTALTHRFFLTVIIYNGVIYPIGIWLWLNCVFSLRPVFDRLRRGSMIDSETLARARRRVINLPWFAAAISAAAWLLCVPIFLGSLWQVQGALGGNLSNRFSAVAFLCSRDNRT